MIYFSAKKTRDFVKDFHGVYIQMRKLEENVRNRIKREIDSQKRKYIGFNDWARDVLSDALKDEEYRILRERYGKDLRKIVDIANELRIMHRVQTQSSPLRGNHSFSGSYFETVLYLPTGLGEFENEINDATNQIVGIMDRRVYDEFQRLINPFYWIKKMVVFIVRLPYSLLKLSGFDMDILQKHIIGKTIQLIYVVMLILILLKLGIDITNINIGI